MKLASLLTAACIAAALSAAALAEDAGKTENTSTATKPGSGKPDLARAKEIVNQTCVACHGADGNSPIPANPSLAGQQAEYISLQLAHFKDGVRNNALMKGMVGALTPDDMRALGVYFSQQKPKGSTAGDADIASSGRATYRGGNGASGVPACASCHAPTGVGIPVRYPRLAGQHADYTLAQLKSFKAGERGMDKAGKDANGRVMAQIASRMSDAEMQAVAQYVAGLH
jgi:cytochrome c553